jgi:cytosine/adenosine deaminase-related metal-dependent hydrolase
MNPNAGVSKLFLKNRIKNGTTSCLFFCSYIRQSDKFSSSATWVRREQETEVLFK